MYSKFHKAAEKRKNTLALADGNDVLCLPSTDGQSHEDSCESINKVWLDASNSTITELNLSEIMEDSLYLSEPLCDSKKPNMFFKERKISQSTKIHPGILSNTGIDGAHFMEISPFVSSKTVDETESVNENSMKPLKYFINSYGSYLDESDQSDLVDSEGMSSVGTKTHDLSKVMKTSLNGSISEIDHNKMTQMDFRKKVPIGTNEKERYWKQMFPTEGSKTVPGRHTEVVENGKHGTKPKMGAAKMVQRGRWDGNLAESSDMPRKNPSDGEKIFQTEPNYITGKYTSDSYLSREGYLRAAEILGGCQKYNKVPVGTNEKERDWKHMFPTEGSKTVPDRHTEAVENGKHGTKPKMGASKMVQKGRWDGNLAESSDMPRKNPSDGEKIFQAETNYITGKYTSDSYLSREGYLRAAEILGGCQKYNKVPVSTNEKERDWKHMFPTEGSKTVPDRHTEAVENGKHGTKPKMGAAKMVQRGRWDGNLAESSDMPRKDASDGEKIFQVEPNYITGKYACNRYLSREGYLRAAEILGSCQKYNKVPVGTNEKERDWKHMFPTEGSKTVPDSHTEVVENGKHGTKPKMGAAKMVQRERREGIQLDMPRENPSDGENIFQAEPNYVANKYTSDSYLSREGYLRAAEILGGSQKYNSLDSRGGEASKLDVPPVVGWRIKNENHMNDTKTPVSSNSLDRKGGEASKLDVQREFIWIKKENHMNDREKMRTRFNQFVQERHPEIRHITDTLEYPSLFDRLYDSVKAMKYNGGKNPVAVLNELMPNLDYYIERSGPPHLPNFKVSVTINGHDYCGVGNTKKAAKSNAAEDALKGIGSNKTTSISSSTSTPKKVESTCIRSGPSTIIRNGPSSYIRGGPSTIIRNGPLSYIRGGPSTSISSGPSTSISSGPSTCIRSGPSTCIRNGPSTCIRSVPSTSISSDPSTSNSSDQDMMQSSGALNAVLALNNLRKGLKYECIGKFGPPHLPYFKVTLRVDEKVYCGTGRSKKLAKASAASKALMDINGTTNNLQGASLGSGPKKNTSKNTPAGKQFVAVSVPEWKSPFAVLNDLYPNPEVSWTGKNSSGLLAFTISLEGRNFKGLGMSLKTAKNKAAAKALQELRGISQTYWQNH